jgi:hypothetical protein
MKLYEITHEIEQLLDAHFDEEGEFIGDDEAFERFAEELDRLQLAHDVKVENTALYIKNLKAEAEALKAEKMAFAERQKQAERKIAWLTGYLTRNMHGSTFESPKVSIKWRKSTSAEITATFSDGLYAVQNGCLLLHATKTSGAGLKNEKNQIKVMCNNCGARMVRTLCGRRHDVIDVYPPDGEERYDLKLRRL